MLLLIAITDVIKAMKDPCHDVHTLLERLLVLNNAIEIQNNTLDGSQAVHEQLKQPLSHFANSCLQFQTHSTLHRVRNNIVASVPSLLFITECRLRLLLNDLSWCDLDTFFREESHLFSQELLFNKEYYNSEGVPFFNTHPLVQYTMSQCYQTLCALLRSTYSYHNIHDIDFVQTLYSAVRDRVAILVNYPCSLDVNDMPQYVVRIGNERAVCTSAFVYDFSIMCREFETQLSTFCHCQSLTHADNYSTFITDCFPSFKRWAGDMIITATGDNFCDFFTKFYLKIQLQQFEQNIYQRQYPQTGALIPYKVLQSIRGVDLANSFMEFGSTFITDLLAKETGSDQHTKNQAFDKQNHLIKSEADEDEDEDEMCTTAQILERMDKLDSYVLDVLIYAVLEYVLTRQWNRSLHSFMTHNIHEPVVDEPRILWVPLKRVYYVLTKTDEEHVCFSTLVDAFLVFMYQLEKHYNGTLYCLKTKEQINCSILLKTMFGTTYTTLK